MGLFDFLNRQKPPSPADNVRVLAGLCGGNGISRERRDAALQLKRMGTPSLDVLRDMLQDPGSQCDAIMALECLGTYANELTPALIDAAVGDRPGNSMALRALGRVADDHHIAAAVAYCIQVAQAAGCDQHNALYAGGYPHNALYGLHAAARSDAPPLVTQAVECLAKMVKDPGVYNRRAAVDALGFILTESKPQRGVHVINRYQVEAPISEAERDSSDLVRGAAYEAWKPKQTQYDYL